MQVDLCVFLAGQNLDAYTPLFFETLFTNCDTFNLCIHVVEKGYFEYTGDYSEKVPWYIILDMKYYVRGVGENVHNYLLKKQAESPVPFHIYEQHDPAPFFRKSTPWEPCFFFSDDHAETLNWAMAHCGTNKWVIFCHSDMVFKKDMVTKLIEGMQDDVGMWGSYSHCFAVNREAFFKVGVKFNAISNFRVVKVAHPGFDYEVKFAADPDCPPDAKIMYGWDVGELLKLIMTSQSWRCNLKQGNQELDSYVDHMCSGHGYVNEATREFQERRRRAWMKEFNVQRI